jgi:bacterial/archaeal transporter family-2 protein
MSRGAAFISTLAVGGLIALQAPVNAALARHVSDLGAALVSLTISLVIVGSLLLIFGHPGRLSGLSDFKPEYVIAGIGGAAVVVVGLIAVRSVGAAGVIALLVAGQLVIALFADRFGWFGLAHTAITPGRVIGILLVIGGTVLVTRT